MREDLLQALLLYYIGSKISTFLKQHLRSFRKAKEGAWASPHRKMDPRDRARRQYYLRGRGSARNSIQGLRDKVYRKHYFLSALKKTVSETSQHVAGEMEAQYSGTPYATFSVRLSSTASECVSTRVRTTRQARAVEQRGVRQLAGRYL
ncbi:uncharacterized protein B0I36DRAFT_352664 [Microdochium trichocladiopsis]|uniref:Uncharacterized protein n=1 Tax=Microdochium trichocladiopsis TaxID=1682393 RepID=A0A9P9BLI6_9PEZI|nr:uncharacterized protein B0I36DRAFT_352664 [Microdochium trichocladiopsis]KAH7024430.1 hypothetical protein B0I36DRAFT_352664 [Microdochium trichocladiopsis]